jgi:hypothetical protein
MKKKMSVAVMSAILVAGVVIGAGAASAQAARGVITGRVMECAPGPIIASPPAPEPTAHPDIVSLYRGGMLYRSMRVAFPLRVPWTGTFTFSVPPARYEVVSSYQDRTSWVNLGAGARDVVNFRTFACPMTMSAGGVSGP